MSAAPPSVDLVSRLRSAGCVFAEDEARLLLADARSPDHLESMTSRRIAGEPLETILGWAEFCGLRVTVEPGVFVPRQRTALLVRAALELAPAHRRAVVLDLCCGSGALGAALAASLGAGSSDLASLDAASSHLASLDAASPPVELVAVDIDPVAVRCATGNLRAVGGQAYCGDLYAPVPTSMRGRVDLLLANTPYVPTSAIAAMPPEARLHEPRVALDGGADGLDLQRRAIGGATGWLAPGGSILVETSDDQAARTLALMHAAGLRSRLVVDDDLDATVAVGTAVS